MNREARPWSSGALVGCFAWLCLAITPNGLAQERSRLDTKSEQFLLSGQEPAGEFVPLKPRSAADQKRLEALKQFCIGVILENRRDRASAIKAYQQALQNDAQSVTIHKSLIRLCIATGRTNLAKEYLNKAIALDPEDYEMLDQLGQYMLEQGDYPQASELYRRAIASKRLEKHNVAAVLLKYKLGVLLELLKNYKDASTFYFDVMEAMERPAMYRLNQLSRQHPLWDSRAETFQRFGKVFRRAQRYDEALRAFRHAQEASPRNSGLLTDIADVYIDQEQYSNALDYLERYLDGTPQGSKGYEQLAEVLRKLGRSDEVLPRIQAAAQQDRFNQSLQYFLGTLYEQQGQTDRAEEVLLSVLKSHGDDRVYESLARIYQKQQRTADLIRVLGDGMENRSRDRRQLIETLSSWLRGLSEDTQAAERVVDTARTIVGDDPSELGFGACHLVAQVAARADLLDDAAHFYRLCLQQRSKGTEALQIYAELSELLAANDRREQAITALRQAIDQAGAGRFPRFHGQLARYLELEGRTDEALEAAGRAVELRPDLITGHSTQAWVFLHAGRFRDAAQRYEQIIRDFADEPKIVQGARYLLSHAYVQLGEIAQAEQALEQVLQEDPNDQSANNDLGYLWADQGKNLQKAEAMIRKALELYAANRRPTDPEQNAAYLDSLGWVLYKQRRFEEARKYLEQAIAAPDGQDGVIIDHLGDVYDRLEQPEKAADMWRKSLKLLEEQQGPQRDTKRIGQVREKLKQSEAQR